jgi:hypothetical protein
MLCIASLQELTLTTKSFLSSALAPDSIVDMTPGNKLWGLSFCVFQGRDIVI